MIELILVLLVYLLGSKLWWLVGVAVLLNKFIKKPLLIMCFLSPFFWLDTLHHLTDNYQITIFHESKINLIDKVIIFSAGLCLCFLIYYGLRKLFLRIDRKSKHPLPFMLFFYSVLFFINLILKHHFNFYHVDALRTFVYIFFSNAFVMIVYELHNIRKENSLNALQSFSLLNTMHSTSLAHGGTQLSPKGTKHLQDSLVDHEAKKSLQVKALKMLVFCLCLKFAADVIGHLFLSFPMKSLTYFSVPTYNLANLSTYHTVPRFFVMTHEHGPKVYLVIFIRSLHWFALRFVGWNSKIALLWFMGFYIQLGVLNPFKSSSFIDFFRRSHVYIADFYKTFIYPYVHLIIASIDDSKLKKYLALWLMIFLGGAIFQTISHYYQLFNWKPYEFFLVTETRFFYDAVLATIICISLYFEKKNKRKNKNNKIMILKVFLYIAFYSLIVSMSASMKSQNFSVFSLFNYFKILLGIE